MSSRHIHPGDLETKPTGRTRPSSSSLLSTYQPNRPADRGDPLTISGVIPVYNGAGYLHECLAALALSIVPPLECIVVDDGSTDDSADVARSFGATVLGTNGRQGPARARNLGARAAAGSVLFFIDSDVCVKPETIALIAQD